MAPRDELERLQDAIDVLRAQRGDARGFERLIERYEQKLLYFIRRFERDEDRALDVLQEIWLAVIKQLPTLRDPSAVCVWLYRIAHNKAVSSIRRQVRESDVHRTRGQSRAIKHGVAEREIENAEIVHRTLDRISTAHREILALRFLESMTLGEIADVLDLNLGTVKSRLHYAKSAFRDQVRGLIDAKER